MFSVRNFPETTGHPFCECVQIFEKENVENWSFIKIGTSIQFMDEVEVKILGYYQLDENY